MSESNILRINSGAINAVDDAQIGSAGLPNGGPVRSHFQGQLGKWLDLDDDNVVFDATIGQVYGGRFQYVRLADSSDTPALGQPLYWDNNVANNKYQVTTNPDASSDAGATLVAGINLNPTWTPGNYGVMQILGTVAVKFTAELTASGAIGCPVYVGADGLADVVTNDATAIQNARYLGKAVDAPVGDQVSLVDLMPQFTRF
jgi:hypothetical protein